MDIEELQSGLSAFFSAELGSTLAYFQEQEVAVKVISGDNAASVGAVTRALGVPIGDVVDARTLPEGEAFVDAVNDGDVFGRVTPEQKRAMVTALQARGHHVAMTGDGVNDVLALKDADLGVAMGSGSPATRAVAKIVLLGLIWFYMHHFCAGIRFLLLDAHIGIDKQSAVSSARLVLIVSLTLTFLLVAKLW